MTFQTGAFGGWEGARVQDEYTLARGERAGVGGGGEEGGNWSHP